MNLVCNSFVTLNGSLHVDRSEHGVFSSMVMNYAVQKSLSNFGKFDYSLFLATSHDPF
jgi:hypothetical protein